MSNTQHTPIRMWTIVEENEEGAHPWCGLYETQEAAMAELRADTAEFCEDAELELLFVETMREEWEKGERISYQLAGDSWTTWTLVGHR